MEELKFLYLNLLQGAILLFSSSGKLSAVGNQVVFQTWQSLSVKMLKVEIR